MPISRRTFIASSVATAALIGGGHASPPRHDCRIFGIGGGGLRSLRVIAPIVDGLAEVTAVSTDRQELVHSTVDRQVPLAFELSGGLGAGSNPDYGREAALLEAEQLRRRMEGADSVILVGGLGGGTATGGMPVLAELGRSVAKRTIAVATMPFYFEGKRRREQTTGGLLALADTADLLIPLPLQALAPYGEERLSMKEAFGRADRVVAQVTDAARVLAMLAERGVVAEPRGRGGAGVGVEVDPIRAVHAACRSPLLAVGPGPPDGVLVHLRGLAPSDEEAAEIEAFVSRGVGVDRVLVASSARASGSSTATVLVFDSAQT